MENINDKEPLVSVLIPAYNEKDYFKIGLDSVVNQTYKNIEIIVCDDSTTDDIKNLMESYTKQYNNIKYYNNGGPLGASGALNLQKCFDLCTGKYVNFLMQDDVFSEEKIEKMVKYFVENENISLVTSYRRLINENGDIISDWNTTRPFIDQTTIFRGHDLGAYVLSNMANIIGEPTTAMFRREDIVDNIADYGGHTMRCLVDVAIWIKVLQKGDAVYIREPLSYFRIHERQKTFDNIIKIWGSLEWYYLITNSYETGHFLNRESLLCALRVWVNFNLPKMYEANRIFQGKQDEIIEAKRCAYECFEGALKYFMDLELD